MHPHADRTRIHDTLLTWYLREDPLTPAVRGEHATYWPGGTAAVEVLDEQRLPDLLDEARTEFGRTKLTLDLYSEPSAVDRAALDKLGFGWSRNFYYLAHTGPWRPRFAATAAVRLQRVGAANLPSLAIVMKQSFGTRLRPPTFSTIQGYVERQRLNLPYLDGFIAYDHAVPVGGITWYLNRDLCRVGLLGVLQAYHGRTIGTQLLRAFVQQVGVGRWMVINTTHDNLGALRLYQREGFTDNVVTRHQYCER